MAKGSTVKRRRMKLSTRLINIGLTALAFAPALVTVLKNTGNPNEIVRLLALHYAGYDTLAGKFIPGQLAIGYVPMGVAFALKFAITMVRRKMPF